MFVVVCLPWSVSNICINADMPCAPTSMRYFLDNAFNARHASRRSSNSVELVTRSTNRSTYKIEGH